MFNVNRKHNAMTSRQTPWRYLITKKHMQFIHTVVGLVSDIKSVTLKYAVLFVFALSWERSCTYMYN